MPATLYRKYRPQRFDDLVGQQHIRVTLTRELSSGNIAHAYLLTGPRGVGKTTIARLLARSVNCTGRAAGDFEPDNTCDACQSMLAGRALDMVEVDAASQTGVDNVRENIIANARVAPSALKLKVFIIDEVHMLSQGAFNALLKLLEEPPAHALFVLATTEVHKVPDTVISRCQRFDFHRVGLEDLRRRLKGLVQAEGAEVDDDVLEDVARRAEGSVRDAESMLGQLLALGEKHVTREQAAIVLPRTDARAVIEFLQLLGARDAAGAIAHLESLVDDGVSLPHFVCLTVELARFLLLRAVNPALTTAAGVTLDAKEEMALLELAPTFTTDRLIRLLQAFRDLERQVKADPIPQLPVELAILEAVPDAVPSAHRPAAANAPQLTPDALTNAPAAESSAKPAAKRAKAPAAKTGGVTVEAVADAWPKVLEHVRTKNHALVVSLKAAVPVLVDGDTLVIGVRFPFHAERIEDAKHRKILETALTTVLGTPLVIRCRVVAAPSAEAALGDLAKSFGGEILPS